MIRVIVEDIAFGKATIFPDAYNVDVVDTKHENMLVISYNDVDGNNKVVTYPMRNIYRYIVCPILEERSITNEKI